MARRGRPHQSRRGHAICRTSGRRRELVQRRLDRLRRPSAALRPSKRGIAVTTRSSAVRSSPPDLGLQRRRRPPRVRSQVSSRAHVSGAAAARPRWDRAVEQAPTWTQTGTRERGPRRLVGVVPLPPVPSGTARWMRRPRGRRPTREKRRDQRWCRPTRCGSADPRASWSAVENLINSDALALTDRHCG